MLVDALTSVGVDTKGLIEDAVQSDLGDSSMSGWRRRSPVPLLGRFDVFDSDQPVTETATGKKLVYRPVPRARGPMRVLESGRHMGNASAAAGPSVVRTGAAAGTTRRRADGSIAIDRRTKRKKWNGYTRPMQTWSDASSLMSTRIPPVAERSIINTIVRAMTYG